MLKPGDWCTQYYAGYWQIVAIYPKYATEDYSGDYTSHQKGDRQGNWVVLKKGFTPKMKFRNECVFVDMQWCEPVSEDVQNAIDEAFAANPKAREKFEQFPARPYPMVGNMELELPSERIPEFEQILAQLPERFSLNQLWELAPDFRQYHTYFSPSFTHILRLLYYPWELTDEFDPIIMQAVLDPRPEGI